MKINKHYSLLLLVLLTLAACKKSFLEVPDKRVLLRQAYIKDLNTTSDYLNGIYTQLGTNFYFGTTMLYPELIADNIKPISGSSSMLNHYNWTQIADDDKSPYFSDFNSNANGLWLSGYRIVRDCDFIIETIDLYKSENPLRADDLKGQAYAIRALVLHQLVNVFAQHYNYTPNGGHNGIPYVKASLYNKEVSSQSVGEVYQDLINDLNTGISLMAEKPSNVKEVNRFEVMNKFAAKALLARVYLFKGDFTNANKLAMEVTAKYPIMVSGEYPTKLYTASDTESLLRLNPGVSNSGYNTQFSSVFYKSGKLFTPTKDIWNTLKLATTDSRNTWLTEIKLADGRLDTIITKFPSSVTSKAAIKDGDYYQTIIRSSEMFLTASESFFMMGDENNARLYLDKIRLRADPTTVPTVASGNSLLELIRLERNKELCFEGIRMFDLLRWKKGVHRSNPLASAASDLPYASPKAIAPIPLSDVQQLGLIQNEGY